MGKKGAGRGCLLNHITIKGIALTLSPLCALSIPTNLLIDRCSSQTVPSSPHPGPPRFPGHVSWLCGLPPRARKTTDYSGGRLTRICHVELTTTCSVCEYIMKQGGTDCLQCWSRWMCCTARKVEICEKTLPSKNISRENSSYSFYLKQTINSCICAC